MQILKKETYFKMIENAEGTEMFKSLFVRHEESGEVEDILREGELSCAFFVSNLLLMFGWIDVPYANTRSIRRVLLEHGWKDVGTEDIQMGDVIFWEETEHKSGRYPHSGFALNEKEAISTSDKNHSVARQHITYGTKEDGLPVRAIEAVYRRTNFS